MNASVVAATLSAQSSPALIAAHRAAAAFHEAMADALDAQAEIDEAVHNARIEKNPAWALDYHAEAKELEPRYAAALGRSAAAMQRVPVKWLAILTEKVS